MMNINTDNNKKDLWNPELYDNKHSFVSYYGNSLIELLNPKKNEDILDLGCGTGDLANQIYLKSNNVIGIDKSQQILALKVVISSSCFVSFLSLLLQALSNKVTIIKNISDFFIFFMTCPSPSFNNSYVILIDNHYQFVF
ncbi:class I SAM-dependent methyltransferase [Staphylococcus saprophyticus]|uniref:class I SAM-dependent methyltransferase n=2 Tax=Staphylococcus saprophyticus TaxID=29385 RepID=UPI000A403829|nr:class I SAM-dependent methyltransferase [Staphylococcus saprophyticus]WMM15363.1 methyltransferase domain-containing protein [Staphylococcus saprophyticus]